MIQVLLEERCVKCNLCVNSCPTNVFEKRKGEVPVISRQDDCQTCYMCELYCPVDALYVAPNADEAVEISEQELLTTGLVGSYRTNMGWQKGQKPVAAQDPAYKFYLPSGV
ncbi:4Fe-4S binding protein [Aeribacillus composti]|uniref:4Fe-4S binding protein n=1 Tax=Aeribacillus composti TaxID=1868734 RepID=UPI002E2139BA|nr:4Fe-4S binding protein [Aeribacillus composti]